MKRVEKSLFKEQLYNIWGVEFIDLIEPLAGVSPAELGDMLKNYEGPWHSISDFIDYLYPDALAGEINYFKVWHDIKKDYIVLADPGGLVHHLFKKN